MSGLAVKLCAFDAYGTLFDFNTVHRCLEELGGAASALRELWRAKQLQYFWQRNQQDAYADFEQVTAGALAVAMKTLGIHRPDLERRLLSLYSDYRAHPDAIDALRALKAKGIRAVVHTNATERLVEASLASSGLDAWFDGVVSVERVRRYKPHPEAYRLLVDASGVPARDICFVSSNDWDAYGAAHFGFQAAWINRAGRPPEALPGAPRLVLGSLAELPPALVAAASE